LRRREGVRDGLKGGMEGGRRRRGDAAGLCDSDDDDGEGG